MSPTRGVKYLFKTFGKGSDHLTFKIVFRRMKNDEVGQYQDATYVPVSENLANFYSFGFSTYTQQFELEVHL